MFFLRVPFYVQCMIFLVGDGYTFFHYSHVRQDKIEQLEQSLASAGKEKSDVVPWQSPVAPRDPMGDQRCRVVAAVAATGYHRIPVLVLRKLWCERPCPAR